MHHESAEDFQKIIRVIENEKRSLIEKMESENRRQRSDIDILTRDSMRLKRELVSEF